MANKSPNSDHNKLIEKIQNNCIKRPEWWHTIAKRKSFTINLILSLLYQKSQIILLNFFRCQIIKNCLNCDYLHKAISTILTNIKFEINSYKKKYLCTNYHLWIKIINNMLFQKKTISFKICHEHDNCNAKYFVANLQHLQKITLAKAAMSLRDKLVLISSFFDIFCANMIFPAFGKEHMEKCWFKNV